jgi:hypothetical protein
MVVNVDRRLFAADATLTVELWNAAQLAVLENNAKCATAQGPGGVTQTQCPPGVTFTDVVPERFTFSIATLGATVELTSQKIAAGEMFRIRLAAPSADRCNATSADLTRAAQAGRMVLGDLKWQTTTRGCIVPKE